MNAFAHPIGRLVACGFLGALLSSAPAQAERADRDKPVNLEAARVTVDDVKRVHLFEGNVVLTQGTLVIRAERLVVTQDATGFQKGIASGGANGLATFRQKREGTDEYVDGRAERIEYDAQGEKAELFNRAYIKSGVDEVSGHFIAYDGKTEQYLVTATPGAKAGSKEGRVSVTIQPKNKGSDTTPVTANSAR